MISRRLRSLLLPEGALLLVLMALLFWSGAAATSSPLLDAAPLVVLAVGVTLCWRFSRGRLLLALASVALSERAMAWLPATDTDAGIAGQVVARTVAVLLPVTLAVLAFSREQPLATAAGQRRLALLGAQGVGVLALALAASAYPAHVGSAYEAALLPLALLEWSPLGQPATVLAGAALSVLAGRAFVRGDAESRGLLWAAVGGVVAVGTAAAGDPASLHFAAAGVMLVASTVESAHALAFRDELTGLPGRRALMMALDRAGATWTVAMVDVDHFKQFNDRHGHDVGDQVLRMVASRLADVTGGGRAFRYGGEEFTVLFAGRGAAECEGALEALRDSVERATFGLRGADRPKRKPASGKAKGRRGGAGGLRVTVSIGAAESRAAPDPAVVLRSADQALYRAKEAGRNRVELA